MSESRWFRTFYIETDYTVLCVALRSLRMIFQSIMICLGARAVLISWRIFGSFTTPATAAVRNTRYENEDDPSNSRSALSGLRAPAHAVARRVGDSSGYLPPIQNTPADTRT